MISAGLLPTRMVAAPFPIHLFVHIQALVGLKSGSTELCRQKNDCFNVDNKMKMTTDEKLFHTTVMDVVVLEIILSH